MVEIRILRSADLASAHYVLQKARERGVGQVIDF